MILPTPLEKGDTLIAIAPSGVLKNPEKLMKGLKIWQERGYKVILEEHYAHCEGYLAGKDRFRRQALAKAWMEDQYKGIICVRGGYGASRLLENWQWSQISQPKWLIGFSDITALLWSLYTAQKIVGLHAPVLTTIADEPDWSLERLFGYLEGKPLSTLQGRGWGGHKATGRILPGNLTVATHLLNTPFSPRFNDVILAFEDVGEAPYRIDRMLTQWRTMGIFNQVQGILLGRFSGGEEKDNVFSWTTEEVFKDRLQDLPIPIISQLPFGHDGVNACLPVGALVNIDGREGTVIFVK